MYVCELTPVAPVGSGFSIPSWGISEIPWRLQGTSCTRLFISTRKQWQASQVRTFRQLRSGRRCLQERAGCCLCRSVKLGESPGCLYFLCLGLSDSESCLFNFYHQDSCLVFFVLLITNHVSRDYRCYYRKTYFSPIITIYVLNTLLAYDLVGCRLRVRRQ